MRRVARAEVVVGAAVVSSAARKPAVVVAAPGPAVVVEAYPPGAAMQPGYYGAPPPRHPPAAAVAMVAAATPGVPVAAAAGVGAAAVVAAERRHFYLINEATGTVLAVDRSLLQPGAHAVIEKRRPDKAFHQIWYLDHQNVIRSRLTDFALETRARDDRVKLAPFMGEARQMWTIEGRRIVNKVVRTDCIGLRKMLRLKEDADVHMQHFEGKPFQHWRMEPIIL